MKGNEGSGNFGPLFYYFFFLKVFWLFAKGSGNVDPKGLRNINGFGEAESWFLGSGKLNASLGSPCQAHYTHMHAGCWIRTPSTRKHGY